MLAVSDTGIGMSPAIQARIFEPFFTTKPKGRGTGLGLATVYAIVKQNNGNIWVYSEPEKGTTLSTFRVSRTSPRALRRQSRRLRSGDEAVLLVEDDAGVRALLKRALTRNGYTVIKTADGRKRCAWPPSMLGPSPLVNRLVMPGISGRRLAEQLLVRNSSLQVFNMSGYTENAIGHHGVLTPGVAFLQKPFTPATVARAAREVLGHTIVSHSQLRKGHLRPLLSPWLVSKPCRSTAITGVATPPL